MRVVRFLFFDPSKEKLNTTQIHVWSIIIGALVGVFVTGYAYALQGLIQVFWTLLPNALGNVGVWSASFPIYNWNWMIPLVWGGVFVGVMLQVGHKMGIECGSIILAIRNVHNPGVVPFRLFFPMLMVSLVSITAGGSAGPEAAVIVMGGAAMDLLNRLLKQPMRERRILTLCGMSAALAAFFGMPLSSAIFVLEVPHHNGMEFYEAISPAVCSSVVSSMVNKVITQRHLGGSFNFIPITTELNYVHLAWSVVLGALAGVTSLLFTAYMKTLKLLVQKSTLDKYPFVMSLLCGALVGICGLLSPSSLFWSENELQWGISLGNMTLPFAKSPSIIPFHSPLLAWELFVTGLFKLLAIGITVSCAWPGGIIFPLLFAGALFGNAWGLVMGVNVTVACTTFMAALEASVLRTPWSAVLIVLLAQGGFLVPTGTYFLEVFPLLIISVMVSMIIVYWTRLYGKEQHGRRDMVQVDLTSMDIQQQPESSSQIFGYDASSSESVFLRPQQQLV